MAEDDEYGLESSTEDEMGVGNEFPVKCVYRSIQHPILAAAISVTPKLLVPTGERFLYPSTRDMPVHHVRCLVLDGHVPCFTWSRF